MSSDTVSLDTDRLLRDVVLTVTIRKSIASRIRVMAMVWLIHLAAKVGGLGGVEVINNAN